MATTNDKFDINPIHVHELAESCHTTTDFNLCSKYSRKELEGVLQLLGGDCSYLSRDNKMGLAMRVQYAASKYLENHVPKWDSARAYCTASGLVLALEQYTGLSTITFAWEGSGHRRATVKLGVCGHKPLMNCTISDEGCFRGWKVGMLATISLSDIN